MLLSTQGLCISVGFLHLLYPFNSLQPSSYPQNTMLIMSPPPVIAVKPFASVPDKQGRIEVMTSGGDTHGITGAVRTIIRMSITRGCKS